MSAEQVTALRTCGCCKEEVSPTPALIHNRPGLSYIHYRVGTYAGFLIAMIEQIARTPELRQRWLARSTDDFGIALLAMWAYIADILAFYQERTANEAYLRTAILQESIVSLAALLDYKPAPGSAAEADLAFFMEQNKLLQIPVGLRVQSVPGQNEKPQKFETIESIAANAALNQLQIFPQPQLYAPFVLGSSQAVLLSDSKGLAPNSDFAIFNPRRAELKQVTALSIHNTQQMLSWTPAIQSADFDAFVTQAAVYGREFRLFGADAPGSYVQPVADIHAPGHIRFDLLTAPYTNSNLPSSVENRLALDAKYNDIKAGSSVLLVQAGSSSEPDDSFARLATVTNVSVEPATYGPLQNTVTWLTLGFAVTSPPVVARDSTGQLNVFVIGDDGALWTRRQNDAAWLDWQSLGGQIDLLAVANNLDQSIEVFARGMDKALWHIRQDPATGDWNEWSSLGGQIDLLSVASNQDGRLEVFVRGTDQALWHIWQTSPNNGWSAWASLGGRIDLLAIGKNQDGRLEVFARGTDRGLWHIWQTAPNNGWSGWASLGGIIDLLGVDSNQDGRLEVFARGTDLALWHIWQTSPNNGWSSWQSLGGQIDLLAVASNHDGRLEVFARGTDKALWHIWQISPNNGWGGWDSLAGEIDLLGVASNDDGRLEVFARGTDQDLQHILQNSPGGSWSNWRTLRVPMHSIFELARPRITVFEVKRMLAFSRFQYGDSISGSTVFIPLPQISGIDNKRSVILDDAALNPQTVQIESAQPIDNDGDGRPDYWRISFSPDLARTLTTASATLYGNVCASTHGLTIAGEVLGDGDASETFQSFRLQKSPVTFVHHPGSPHGVADTLQIQLSGVIWKEVEEFYGHTSTERIFTTSQDAKGMTVQFGDGVSGSGLPTGRGNVVANYRQGIGLVGNVVSGALRTLLDRPVGLRKVSNPGAATGGADPESLDQTRDNAPNTVRTFRRIVSLEDFEDAAREFAGVAKAHASWEWSGEEQVVYLTVAGVKGAAILGQTYLDLVSDLNSRRDPNRSLRVRSYNSIPISLSAAIFVAPDYVPDDVLAAAQVAATSYFSFASRQLGEPVHLSNVYAALQGVAGIMGVDIITLQYKYPGDAATHGATSDPVQVHLRINDDELAALENPSADAVITIGQVQS